MRTITLPLSYSFPRRGSHLDQGDVPYFTSPWKSTSKCISILFNHCMPKLVISCRKKTSTLEQVVYPFASEPVSPTYVPPKYKRKTYIEPIIVKSVLKRIPQDPVKVNLVLKLISGMHINDAMLQLQVCVKKAAHFVLKVVKTALYSAVHYYGIKSNRLLISEAIVGKGRYTKFINYHAKGKSGIREKPECRVTIILREITKDDEMILSRLRFGKYRNLDQLIKKEKRRLKDEAKNTRRAEAGWLTTVSRFPTKAPRPRTKPLPF